MLLKLPKTPNCPQIFWPVASASMRLYCAQLEAETGQVDDLLQAIALVKSLPEDHPLREEIDRNVQQWSADILNIAETKFQDGDLEGAIAIGKKIPAHLEAYKLVEERIERWRSIWSEGEGISADVEAQLRQSNWNQAFRLAVQLLNIDNQYWATTKYDLAVAKIQLAQEENKKLDTAHAVLRRGGIDNWLKAIEEAEKIGTDSYSYQEARNLIEKAEAQLLSYAEKLIDSRNWDELEYLSEKLPGHLSLSKQVEDWKTLARAGIDSQFGTTDSLQAAILAAQEIEASSPLYEKAQDLVNLWTKEAEDVTILTEAKEIAKSGSVQDLNQAIAKAEMVSRSHPRYREARQEIRDWTRRLQIIEDEPILAQARLIARAGDVNSLRAAISQASVIGSGRALSSEAQVQIGHWQASIERQEDRPYLARAIALASVKDYQTAINAASQIQRGRVLYREAQEKIRGWEQEIKAGQDFQRAYSLAEAKTAEALVTAIGIVKQIPGQSDVGAQSQQALDRWSFQLLSLATDKANQREFAEAIRLAGTIPSNSAAYRPAQGQIKIWQQILEPAPAPAPASLPPDNNSEPVLNL
jgi:hypothetical protein